VNKIKKVKKVFDLIKQLDIYIKKMCTKLQNLQNIDKHHHRKEKKK